MFLQSNFFKLVDQFGNFYISCQKIWTFLSEVFDRNQQYLNIINKEINTDHFETINAEVDDFKLQRFNHITGNPIVAVPNININKN